MGARLSTPMRARFLTVAVAAVVLTCPVSTQSVLDVAGLLDRYSAGKFDEAIQPVANGTDEQARYVREQLMTAGRLWIDAPGHSKSDRLAAAAAFALETEALRVERGDWVTFNDGVCAGRCVIEWACALLNERNETPDAFEHDWFAATVTLASGERDWAFLHTPRLVAEPFGESHGHVDHALERFPGDARFRFARAQAVASRFEVTTEQDAPREGVRLELGAAAVPNMVINGPPAIATTVNQRLSTAAARRATQRSLVLKEFADLSTDPVVGVAARTRLAYLEWAGGDYDAALTEAQAAAAQTTDADERYLARYIAGMAAQSSGALAKAESLFAAALEARPRSQSASLSLAALLFQRGDATGAHALSEKSLVERKNDDDPWRLFQYGDYKTFPEKRQALRRALPTEGK